MKTVSVAGRTGAVVMIHTCTQAKLDDSRSYLSTFHAHDVV